MVSTVYLDDKGNVTGVSGITTKRNWRKEMNYLAEQVEVVK